MRRAPNPLAGETTTSSNPATAAPPEPKGRIPLVNLDYITIVQKKFPYLFEPFILLTRKLNQIISGGNLKSRYPHVIALRYTTPQNDVYWHLPILVAGTGLAVYGCIRKAITVDYSIRINCFANSYSGSLGIFHIPKTTEVNVVVSQILKIPPQLEVDDMACLTFDCITGDSQFDNLGMVALALEWTA